MAVNPSNAQIRRGGTTDRDERAMKAARLLEDDAFQGAHEMVRETIVGALEDFKSDGSPESEAYERELCRSLRTLKSVRRVLALAVQGTQLRAADFRPQPVENDL